MRGILFAGPTIDYQANLPDKLILPAFSGAFALITPKPGKSALII
jgi:hypothetical protein